MKIAPSWVTRRGDAFIERAVVVPIDFIEHVGRQVSGGVGKWRPTPPLAPEHRAEFETDGVIVGGAFVTLMVRGSEVSTLPDESVTFSRNAQRAWTITEQ